ncbi:PREDICTED: alpha-1,3-mannosyl-glycoprotein 4-beta-N-acetylglucosaminyltransferase C-like [Branchiostoma belcheri]|uniref:Alpha-1,3-mannosyl-glycoprotein 4-beta-N-acetylglucosaminyltransferase C-like n=1 Tax=Branchiostoma belcheri TaxID=7741 RepID=A0A6P4YLW1_BRABE|nr:PREDICTED: alpha-1,3-mannosyl-glycoprotein 4-beta-N-acetylglucosaminyltransferase C-like [Branchiostoma belcheri]
MVCRRMMFLRQVVLVCMVVSMFLNFWMLTGTELQNVTSHIDLGEAVQTCEPCQREMLSASMNETLRGHRPRMERRIQQHKTTSPPPANPVRPTGAVTDSIRLAGSLRPDKGFLTIGIPTVKRDQNASYLTTTLDSLISHTTEAERKQIVIVVFLADFDTDYNQKLSTELSQKYSLHLNSGLMQVIQAPRSFYPSLDNLKTKFKDSPERVRWRSKQCVDYAYLFQHCRNLSEYYMQLEDDVISAQNFLTGIKEYLERMKSSDWTVLEFSGLGFIGKLFRSSDLQRLADLIMLFYQESPVDVLFFSFLHIVQASGKKFIHQPSLFQHVGLHSSLAGKIQKLTDKGFVGSTTPQRTYTDSDNPPAAVSANMTAYREFKPQLAYGPEMGYFWAEAPKVGQVFVVLFEKPARLSRIVIETGSEEHPKDILEKGTLEVSPRLLSVNEQDNTPNCADYVKLGNVENGRFEVATQGTEGLGSVEVKCLKVTVTGEQKMWVLAREIAVWTVKK